MNKYAYFKVIQLKNLLRKNKNVGYLATLREDIFIINMQEYVWKY